MTLTPNPSDTTETETQISMVVAVSTNWAIGKNNQLLWHLPADLKHFKKITSGHTVIMGRKTFASIGKPLPNRCNIVITRQNLLIDGCEVTHNVQDALALCASEQEVFIIGGAEIYRQSLAFTHRIYLTQVHQNFEADTFFPELTDQEWRQISREDHEPDEKNQFAYSYLLLERR